MKNSILLLTLVFLISGCGKSSSPNSSSSNEPKAPSQPPPEPKTVSSGPQMALYGEVTIGNEKASVKLSNIGWCEPKSEDVCILHDYTRIEIGSRTGHIYRTIEFDPKKSRSLEDLKISPTKAGLALIFDETSKKFDEAMKLVRPKAKIFKHSAVNLTYKHDRYLKFEQADFDLAMSKCRTVPIRQVLLNHPPSTHGNLLVFTKNFAFLDNKLPGAKTFIEFDRQGNPVGIVTEFQTSADRTTERDFDFDEEPKLRLREGGLGSLLQSIDVRANPNFSTFRYDCNRFYTDKLGLKLFDKTYRPYTAYYPFYNAKFDQEISKDLASKYNIKQMMKNPYQIFEDLKVEWVISDEDYLNLLPLTENILPEDQAAYREAFPSPLSRKDFQ